MKNVVKTDKAPGAIGPYSQGINVGDMYFFSGQIPLVPETGEMPEGIEAQAHQSLKNDFVTVNDIYAQYFVEPFPARSAVEVAKLPKGALIEVEVIATK